MGIGEVTPWSRKAYDDARSSGSSDDAELLAIVQRVERVERAAAGDDTEDEATITSLVEEVVHALSSRGIQPRRSRLTGIFAEVHKGAAEYHERRGNHFLAAWQGLLRVECDRTLPMLPSRELAQAARDLVRPVLGSSGLLDTIARLAAFDGREKVTVDVLRAHRLAGAHFETLAFADAALRGLDDNGSRGIRWQSTLCRMHLAADTAPLSEFFETIGALGSTPERTWAKRYEYAVPKKRAMDRVGESGSNIEAMGDWILEILQACHDQDIPIHQRLLRLGTVLWDSRGTGQDPEEHLVLLAALARWLFQAKKYGFVEILLSAYRDVSLALSAQRNTDVLGFTADIEQALHARSLPVLSAPVQMKSTWAERTGGTAAMVTELVAQLGVSRVRRLFSTGVRAKRLQEEERSAIIRTVIRRVDALKGPPLKMAQHLSYVGLELDPEIDDRLRALQDESTAVDFASVVQVVEEDFGKPIDAVFSSFLPEPIGVGSIGQVHAAELLDGTAVAVKVQFPGVREAIVHDLWHLGLWVPLATILRPKVDWRGAVKYLRWSLLSECDYVREAKIQEAFRKHFSEDPVLRVPRVHPEFCSARVLTTDRIEGSTLDDFATNASYSERRTAADALLRLLFAFVDDQYTWSDPHPGNYVVTDDHIYVLDFGCVAEWDPVTRHRWVCLGQGMMNRDEVTVRRGIRELGFPVDPDRFDYREYFEKFHPEHYTSTVDEAGVALVTPAVVTRQLIEFFSRRSRNFHNIRIPPELILGLRAYYGTMYVLAKLRTGVDSENKVFRGSVDEAVAASERALARLQVPG
ncbi:MAG: hypothetical protein KC416_03135 [Myxococcales bacterium]|nr:hypothetical protein [Myxococcales bacterium]